MSKRTRVRTSNAQCTGESAPPPLLAQVKAMEERAKSVGMADHLHYMWPDTHYIAEDLNRSMLVRANALGLSDRLVMDLHTGPTGGVPLAKAFFNNLTQTGGGGAGAINAEVT